MDIRLDIPDLAGCRVRRRRYDPALDDIRSMLHDVCEGLSGHATFSVSACGEAPWPVDVGTDLCVVLEQLPEALGAARRGKDFDIDFYEQGIDCLLEFRRQDASYRVHCSSLTRPVEYFEEEIVPVEAVAGMLDEVLERFVAACRTAAPHIAASDGFDDWLNPRSLMPINFAIRPGKAGGLTIWLAPGGETPDLSRIVHMDERAFYMAEHFFKPLLDEPYCHFGLARIPARVWPPTLAQLDAFARALEDADGPAGIDWFGSTNEELLDAFELWFAKSKTDMVRMIGEFRVLIESWIATSSHVHFFGV
jgi:hypothetical protein